MGNKKMMLSLLFTALFCFTAFTQNAEQKDTTGEKTTSQNSEQGLKESIPGPDTTKIPVLDFKNTDIRDVLRALGMQYGINIYLEPEVEGNISLYLTNINVKDAVDFIISRHGYSYTVKNSIVRVFKKKEPAPEPEPEPEKVFNIKDGLVSVDVQDITPDEAGRLFTDSAGINVVVEGKTDKEITCHLKGIEVEKALRVLFESNGYEVNQRDGVYFVSMRNWGAEDENGRRELRRLSVTVTEDSLVTMEVNNAELYSVIRSIAIQSGINIFIYEKVSGSISAKCDSLHLEDAFRFLMQNTNYTFWKDKSIYFIGSREMSQQKTTVTIPLKHIMADNDKIGSLLPPYITSNSVIKYDSEHNSVIIIGSYDITSKAENFIRSIDRPVPQVLIEALVVDFNVDKIREFGISVFTGGLNDTSSGWMSEQFVPNIELKPGKEKTERALRNVLKFVGVDKIVKLPENFRSSINALETSNIVKVHSTPQIATLSGNPASITIGETRYYKLVKETKAANLNSTSTLGTDERFETVKFNTNLNVTPWVMDKGYLIVKIRPEFNIPRAGGDASKPPNVDTRVIESMVRLRNGQTIVLGGQRQTESIVKGSGVPFLSSIPILGYLFSNKRISEVETQMMIFLTPHVYYGDEGEVSPEDYFGKKIEKMLEDEKKKSLIERIRERREKRKEEKKKEEENEIEKSVEIKKEKNVEPEKQEDKQTEKENEEEKGFKWPWAK